MTVLISAAPGLGQNICLGQYAGSKLKTDTVSLFKHTYVRIQSDQQARNYLEDAVHPDNRTTPSQRAATSPAVLHWSLIKHTEERIKLPAGWDADTETLLQQTANKELSISEHNHLRHNTTKNTASSQANVRKLKHNHICDGWLRLKNNSNYASLRTLANRISKYVSGLWDENKMIVSNKRVESEILSYLSEISNVKQIESLKQLALLHAKYLWAGVQKCPDVLQAEELDRNKRHILY